MGAFAAGRARRWAGLAGAAVLLYSGLYAAAMDGILSRTDNRFLASQWIRDHVPAGTPVGRLRHPEYAGIGRDFPLPPVLYVTEKEAALGLAKPYPAAWVSMEPGALSDPGRPRFLVATSYELRDYPRLEGSHPAEAAFVRDLLAGRGYVERIRFLTAPRIGGLRIFPARHPPHDWIYAWPEVRIYERPGSAGGG